MVFVYDPALIWMIGFFPALYVGIKASIGAMALSAAVVGFMKRRLIAMERLAALVAAFMLIKPGWITDVIGVVVVILLLLQRKKKTA